MRFYERKVFHSIFCGSPETSRYGLRSLDPSGRQGESGGENNSKPVSKSERERKLSGADSPVQSTNYLCDLPFLSFVLFSLFVEIFCFSVLRLFCTRRLSFFHFPPRRLVYLFQKLFFALILFSFVLGVPIYNAAILPFTHRYIHSFCEISKVRSVLLFPLAYQSNM